MRPWMTQLPPASRGTSASVTCGAAAAPAANSGSTGFGTARCHLHDSRKVFLCSLVQPAMALFKKASGVSVILRNAAVQAAQKGTAYLCVCVCVVRARAYTRALLQALRDKRQTALVSSLTAHRSTYAGMHPRCALV